MTAFWLTFIKFFVVGGVGFGFDFLVTYILKEKWRLQKFTANTIGFFVGVVFRFFANKYWSFQNTNPNWGKQILQFGLVALIGLAIVNGIIYLLHDKLGLLNFYKAKIVAMIIFMIWNFTANYLWTFSS